MINKYVHKYLAHKKGNKILVWIWNDSVDHRLALSQHSKRVARIIIPNHLIISPLVFTFSPCLTQFWEVYSVIWMS